MSHKQTAWETLRLNFAVEEVPVLLNRLRDKVVQITPCAIKMSLLRTLYNFLILLLSCNNIIYQNHNLLNKTVYNVAWLIIWDFFTTLHVRQMWLHVRQMWLYFDLFIYRLWSFFDYRWPARLTETQITGSLLYYKLKWLIFTVLRAPLLWQYKKSEPLHIVESCVTINTGE